MGQFDFVSPGAMAGDAVSRYFADLQERRLKQAAEQRAVGHEQRLAQQHAAAIEMQREQLKSLDEQRKANIAKGQQYAEAKATTARAEQNTAGVRQMIGDRMQQGPVDADAARQLAGMAYGAGADVPGMVTQALTPPKPGDGPKVGTFEDYVVRTHGPNPTADQVMAARKAWEQANDTVRDGNGAPGYYSPVTTGQGIFSFDHRTGKFSDTERRDLKPGETAQKELANGQTIMWMMDQMTANMTPEKIGPVLGRFKTVEQAITGGDPAFAALSSQTAQLQNVVINLRTGAAMSEPEAARILAELPGVNLPPATFLARLQNAQSYYKEWQQNRAKGAYGRTTTGDVDRMVSGGGEAAPAQPAPGVVAPAAGPKKLRYNPATKTLE